MQYKGKNKTIYTFITNKCLLPDYVDILNAQAKETGIFEPDVIANVWNFSPARMPDKQSFATIDQVIHLVSFYTGYFQLVFYNPSTFFVIFCEHFLIFSLQIDLWCLVPLLYEKTLSGQLLWDCYKKSRGLRNWL